MDWETRRKVKTVPDELVLEWINSGRIIIKYLNRRDPVVVHRGRVLSPYLVKSSGSDRTRWAVHLFHEYRDVKKCRCKRKCDHKPKRVKVTRNILRAKLVWMYKERKVVPIGHEIHHKDLDRYNDRAGNLVDLDEDDHKNEHYEEIPF